MNQASAHFGPFLPMGWLGDRPSNHELQVSKGTPFPSEWLEVAVQRRMAYGIEITADRRGFLIYGFGQWAPGLSRSKRPLGAKRRFRTVRDVSEGAKPALIQRLRVMNAHLSLLHGVAMYVHNESPEVRRVTDRDLYRFDYPDDSAEGVWFRPPGERLPDTVTALDRERLGVTPLATFSLSVDWLELVLQADALIDFDLLNQTQSALRTHDYCLAVVAGWTACELRLRALARTFPLPGLSTKSTAEEVCRVLADGGHLAPELTPRLATLRQRRNHWLHRGTEPEEGTAIEAVYLAAELLRSAVPDLKVRASPGMLML
jgi:hypothetical protein